MGVFSCKRKKMTIIKTKSYFMEKTLNDPENPHTKSQEPVFSYEIRKARMTARSTAKFTLLKRSSKALLPLTQLRTLSMTLLTPLPQDTILLTKPSHNLLVFPSHNLNCGSNSHPGCWQLIGLSYVAVYIRRK